MSTATKTKPPTTLPSRITCSRCGKEDGGRKAKGGGIAPSSGWKRIASNLLCPDCGSTYLTRVISARVSGLDGETWADFRAALNHAWGEATRISNWAVATLLSTEQFVGGKEKPPKREKLYLYGLCNDNEIRRGFPSGATLKTLTRAEAAYQKDRWKISTGRASAPSMRFPQPFYAEFGKSSLRLEDGRLKIKITLPTPDGGTKMWSLVLAGGWRNQRTAAALQRVLAGEVDAREISICGQGPHIMVRLACLFPREDRPKDEGTLYIRSTQDVFCEAISAESNRIWALHEDLMLRWIEEHSRRLQNFSDDRKAERRSRQARRKSDLFVDAMCDKQRMRLKTRLQQIAACICNWAKRQRAGHVLWDDWPPNQSGPNSTQFSHVRFPWHQFKEILDNKLDAEGIAIERRGVARAPVTEDDPVPLA